MHDYNSTNDNCGEVLTRVHNFTIKMNEWNVHFNRVVALHSIFNDNDRINSSRSLRLPFLQSIAGAANDRFNVNVSVKLSQIIDFIN